MQTLPNQYADEGSSQLPGMREIRSEIPSHPSAWGVGETPRSQQSATPVQWRREVRSYGTALLFVLISLVATLFLQRFFPYPFLFLFFAAVMMSAWFGGTGPGLFAVLLSTIVVGYFFVPPVYSFEINATDTTYFAAFILSALVATWVSSRTKKSEEALRQAKDQLEVRVMERTVELQKSNTQLRENERQLRLLTEVIPQQIWSGRADGSIDYCNHRLLDYVGCAMGEMHGEQFMERLHPDDRSGFREAWQQAVSTETPFEGEWRVRGANGEYRSFFTRAVPLHRSEGTAIRWYGTNTDIEEHKKAEQALLRTQSELAHLSRVLTMGELTASIAHEVNQPLTAVVTYGYACLEWLSANPPNLPEAREAADQIIKDGTRAGAVIGRIRSLFGKGAPAKDWVDMNEIIEEMMVFLRDDAARKRVSLRTELAPNLPRVTGDRVQLQQVVLNLAMNGLDSLQAKADGVKELVIRSSPQNSDEILISVEDTGIGLNSELGNRIFEPFFTTKAKGLGMGLSISRSIIESHEGRLWAIPGRFGGAMFQFTVPLGS